jgi:glycosyltransferase involved in cell wall biosynthesis
LKNAMKRVLVIQSEINQYRLPFFAKLNELLRAEGIRLTVAYSDPACEDACKNDTCDVPEAFGMKVKSYWLWKGKLLYQPVLRAIAAADLIIVEQANKHVVNHVLLALCVARWKRVAFWGLGKNRQANQLGISEWYRRKTLDWASWWFAYTRSTADYLVGAGVKQKCITVVQNAVDTRGLREAVTGLTETQRCEARAHLGIGPRDPVGVYCGMLHKVKALPFLVDAARVLRAALPNFHLLVIGGGPDQPYVEQEARNYSWMHCLGPRPGNEKAPFLGIADVALQPGRVGLVILDCFAAGLPLLTTRLPNHGPEMDYLEEGVNGLVSEPAVEAFAQVALELFSDPDRLRGMQQASLASSEHYSIEAMAANVCNGVLQCMGISGAAKKTSWLNFKPAEYERDAASRTGMR